MVVLKQLITSINLCCPGYLTEAGMNELLEKFGADYPTSEKERIRATHHHTWHVLYNCGQQVPPGRYL